MQQVQNNLKKTEDKLNKHPDSKKYLSKVEKQKSQLEKATEAHKTAESLNKAFKNTSDTQWKLMEQSVQKATEEKMKEIAGANGLKIDDDKSKNEPKKERPVMKGSF